MKNFVNSLSIFRIVASFAIIPTLMFQWYWLSFILYTLAGVSDFVDGYLARKYNATSKLGGVLDHIGDKFLVINTMIMIVAIMPAWIIFVPVILMVSRELYVSGLREFVGTQKMEMPVDSRHGYFSMGKVKAFLQMTIAGAFLLFFALTTATDVYNPGTVILYIRYILLQIGMWGLWVALIASLWSAIEYTISFVRKFPFAGEGVAARRK